MYRPAAPALALCALIACGDNRPPAPDGPPPSGETITGRERIGWIQPATDTAELATFSYAIYVDDERRPLSNPTCGSTGGASGFDCSAQLPALTPGAHRLELATFVTSGGTILESTRSAALQVTVVAVTTAQQASASDGATTTTRDGLRVRATTVARGLDDPTDMAFAPDGRLFIAERAGRVRVLDAGTRAATDIGRVAELDVERGGLLAITLHPAFTRTHLVYFIHAADNKGSPTLRLTRAVEHGGSLGQAAVLLEEPAPGLETAAAARFGPDGTLYIATGDGGDSRLAQDLSSLLGKVLRLTAEGATPHDNPRASPVFSLGHRAPRGIAWHPDTAVLWEVERNGGADEINRVVANGNYGWPLARGTERRAGAVAAELSFPEGTLAGAAFFAGAPDKAGFHGDLFIASDEAQDLLRVRFVEGRPAARAERLLHGRFGRISQVAQGPDGALYVTTANRDAWGAGQDLLIRLSPDR